MASHSSASRPAHLEPSPAGTVWVPTRNPAAVRLSAAVSRYRGATVESVTTKRRDARGSAFRQYAPAWASSPRWITMS